MLRVVRLTARTDEGARRRVCLWGRGHSSGSRLSSSGRRRRARKANVTNVFGQSQVSRTDGFLYSCRRRTTGGTNLGMRCIASSLYSLCGRGASFPRQLVWSKIGSKEEGASSALYSVVESVGSGFVSPIDGSSSCFISGVLQSGHGWPRGWAGGSWGRSQPPSGSFVRRIGWSGITRREAVVDRSFSPAFLSFSCPIRIYRT